MEKAIKIILAVVLIIGFSSCDLFSEGDPVEPKQGIIGKWQDDADPDRIMSFNNDGTGMYRSTGVDQEFKYKFLDNDTIKFTFPNKNTLEWDVRTTTRYLWVTAEGETSRLHKME